MRSDIEIIQELYQVKAKESELKQRRIELEAELEAAIKVPEEWEGSRTRMVGPYKVKLNKRINVTINADTLKRVAEANGLTDRLDTLFRWKVELIKKAWKAAPEKERAVFAEAMESKPGKASFNIELPKEED